MIIKWFNNCRKEIKKITKICKKKEWNMYNKEK